MTKKNRKLKAVDLFSGCGGLTVGLKKAGFEVIGAVDVEPLAMETYQMNHPEVTVWREDIRKLSGRKMMRKLGIKKRELDLLAGCPPCQGFSSIRTLNGNKTIKDDRNDLIFDFLRLIKEFMPKAVMMENVPGLLTDKRMEKLKKELKTLGYRLGESPTVLNVAEYGVPQRRRRMILMAGRSGPIAFAKKAVKLRTVRDTIEQLKPHGRSGDTLHDLPENRTSRISAMISRIPKNGGSHAHLGPEWQLPCHKRSPNAFTDVYGRMRWDDVAPTITGGCCNPSKGRFLHPKENRAITLREAAMLQSFPKQYKFSLREGKEGVETMIGNALPPEFIRRQALQIKEYLATL